VNATAALVLIGVLAVLVSLLRLPLERGARLVGPLASVGVAILLALATGILGIAIFVRTYPEFFLAYRPGRVAWPPVALLAIVGLSTALARWANRRPARVRRIRRLALAASGAAALAFLVASLTYGRDNRVRHVVEDRTLAGGSVVRFYIGLTDRDGDGFSFAFGGGDCNDADPSIHPGAPDLPGDGVDADCFAGDGGPEVAPLGEGQYGRVPIGVPARPNVLFISVDAMRPDHLGFNGYPRETSPRMDALSETAIRFDNAYAQSTRSIRSMSTLMTGLYPSEVQFGQELEWTSLAPSNQTLAEQLAAHGWQTGVAMGSTYFERAHGFFQGFEQVHQGADTTRNVAAQRGLAMMESMAEQEAPWFLWIHLMNVHAPYLPDHRPSRFGTEPIDQYDEEIALADQQVGVILDRLDSLGLSDETIVVFFSDHGEAFGEHGVFGHTQTLYEEELRALMMIRVPGIEPRAVSDRVGLLDLFATTLNLVRQPVPRPVASRSALPLMTGAHAAPEDRVLIAEILPDGRFPFDRKAILRGRYKLHWWVREGRFQLFDLEHDPGEEDDLSAAEPQVATQLLGLLRSWTSTMSLPEQQREHAIRSDVLRAPPEHLEHPLGYSLQGVFTILGCDIDEAEVRPGGSLSVQCFYRVDSTTGRNFQFRLEAVPPPGHPRLHHMSSGHYPVGGRYMTSEWQEGEIVRDRVALALPDSLREDATLTVRLSVRDGRRTIPFEGARTALTIAQVRVRSRARGDRPAPSRLLDGSGTDAGGSPSEGANGADPSPENLRVPTEPATERAAPGPPPRLQ
ncbi:MAG TPA: hypothetical protein ENK57_25355, partial [Polyangiaceae bacterium]|nr:hypothetical protein [Polyangiaceae bacterium]